MRLILASNSPRRKQLLKKLNMPFEIITDNFDETLFGEDAIKTAKVFAKGKASAVYNKLKDKKGAYVLGADTVVQCDGVILGKPKDEQEAIKTLKFLSGKKHLVVTGFCILYENNCISDCDITEVEFNELTDEQIKRYVESGLYKGKAGAYGIQDEGYDLVKEYVGSLDNVIGLPTEKIFSIINEINSNY